MPTLHGIPQESTEAKLKKLDDEVAFLRKFARVFNNPEGLDILDWMLDKCYLHTPANSERAQGLQDWALELLRITNKASLDVSKSLLERWHLDYQKVKTKKRKDLQEQLKQESG